MLPSQIAPVKPVRPSALATANTLMPRHLRRATKRSSAGSSGSGNMFSGLVFKEKTYASEDNEQGGGGDYAHTANGGEEVPEDVQMARDLATATMILRQRSTLQPAEPVNVRDASSGVITVLTPTRTHTSTNSISPSAADNTLNDGNPSPRHSRSISNMQRDNTSSRTSLHQQQQSQGHTRTHTSSQVVQLPPVIRFKTLAPTLPPIPDGPPDIFERLYNARKPSVLSEDEGPDTPTNSNTGDSTRKPVRVSSLRVESIAPDDKDTRISVPVDVDGTGEGGAGRSGVSPRTTRLTTRLARQSGVNTDTNSPLSTPSAQTNGNSGASPGNNPHRRTFTFNVDPASSSAPSPSPSSSTRNGGAASTPTQEALLPPIQRVASAAGKGSVSDVSPTGAKLQRGNSQHRRTFNSDSCRTSPHTNTNTSISGNISGDVCVKPSAAGESVQLKPQTPPHRPNSGSVGGVSLSANGNSTPNNGKPVPLSPRTRQVLTRSATSSSNQAPTANTYTDSMDTVAETNTGNEGAMQDVIEKVEAADPMSEPLRVGDKCKVNALWGRVFYRGLTSFGEGEWLAVVLDHAHPSNMLVVEIDDTKLTSNMGGDLAPMLKECGIFELNRVYVLPSNSGSVTRILEYRVPRFLKAIRAIQAYVRVLRILREQLAKRIFATNVQDKRRQIQPEYASVDTLAQEVASDKEKTIELLANYLTMSPVTNTPMKRIRALFRWVSHHVHMCSDTRSRKAEEVFSDRMADAWGMSNLFHALITSAGFTGVVIEGFAKHALYKFGDVCSGVNHAWNAVLVDGTWRLMDTAWSAGVMENGVFRRKFTHAYFDTPPSMFHIQHYPLRLSADQNPPNVPEVESMRTSATALQCVREKDAISIAQFADFILVDRVFVAHHFRMIHPQLQYKDTHISPYYTLTFEAPKFLEYMVEVWHPSFNQPLDPCWHVQSLEKSDTGRQLVNVHLVFPLKGVYRVVVRSKTIENEVFTYERAFELSVETSTGVQDIPLAPNHKIWVGFLKRRRCNGRDPFEAEFRLMAPFKGYFELDAPFRLTVIGPKETEQVVVVNNGNWTNLVPKMLEAQVAKNMTLPENQIRYEADITLKDFPSMHIYYRRNGKYKLLYEFMTDLSDEVSDALSRRASITSIEPKRRLSLGSGAALEEEKKELYSGVIEEVQLVHAPSGRRSVVCLDHERRLQLKMTNRIILDTWGRSFSIGLREESIQLGTKTARLTLSSFNIPNLLLNCYVREGWSGGVKLPESNAKIVRDNDLRSHRDQNELAPETHFVPRPTFTTWIADVSFPQAGLYTIVVCSGTADSGEMSRLALQHFVEVSSD